MYVSTAHFSKNQYITCAKHTTDYELHKYTQLCVLNISVFACEPT